MKVVLNDLFAQKFPTVIAKLLLAFIFSLAVTQSALADDEAIMQRLNKLERALDNQGLLDLFRQLESLQAEVQTLRGQLEEQQYTIERLRQSQRDAYVDLDRRLQESMMNPGLSAAETDEGLTAGGNNPPLTVYQPGEQPEVAGTPAPGIDVQVQSSPALNPSTDQFGGGLNAEGSNANTATAVMPSSEGNTGAVQMREEPAALGQAF